jgi:hypothetical protein
VVTEEALIVSQKGLRQGAREISRFVTRSTLPGFPLRFVLVAREALTHRRERRSAWLHHAAMARHTLSLNLRHGQVPVVVESDGGSRRGAPVDQRTHAARIGVMTRTAARCVGARVTRSVLGTEVAAVATEAGGLAGRTAGQPGEVGQMREARRRALCAGGQDHGREQRE